MNEPRRSLRLALIEVNQNEAHTTPTKTSPDELVIIQRGPRRKPITWSPLDLDNEQTPTTEDDEDEEGHQGEETLIRHKKRGNFTSNIRRRLVLSPSKNISSNLGEVLAKKLRTLKRPILD